MFLVINMHTERTRMNKTHSYGFNLIELMITVVIIGILAAIAYPSYIKYMKQTRRSDAQIALSEIASREEKFFAQCRTYTTALNGTIPACTGLGYIAISPGGHYALSIVGDTSNGSCATAGVVPANFLTCGYTATANPNGAGLSNLQVNNGSLRIDAAGVRQWNRENKGVWLSWSAK